MVAGLELWSSCMAGKGYTVDSPADLITDLVDRLSRATPEEAMALAEEERRIAVADFDCRGVHLDPAAAAVAEDLAPEFVAANQTQLESLMPPEPVSVDEWVIPTDLGTGDVQVTLLWSAAADLDLKVRDPEGYSIDYSTRESPTGGTLDRDANRGCGEHVQDPVENIFWPPGEAPRGDYSVQVTLYLDCGAPTPIDFILIVKVDGRILLNEHVSIDGGSYSTEFRY